ncbi:hypothetical protein ACI78P_04795 [Leuconostoc mesenteroides]
MLIGFTLIMTYISFNPINRVDAFFQTYVEQLNGSGANSVRDDHLTSY